MPFFWSILLGIFPSCVAYWWAVRCFPPAARKPKRVVVALVALALAQVVAQGMARWMPGPFAGAVHMALMTAGVSIAIVSLPLGLLLACSWAAGRIRRRSQPSPARIARRQVLEAGAGIALFGATGTMLGWGIVRGRHEFRLIELSVAIPGLPRALEGYVVAQLSDIHAGPFVDEREIDTGFDLVRRARPDLIVVTGDLVDHESRFAPLVARKLRALPARDGVFACLGNHDYYAGAERIERAMSDAGVTLLVDEGRVIRAGDGGGFALLGVDDLASRHHGRRGPRVDRAISTVPRDLPRVLLSHQPTTVDRWAGRVALQLSGHTHGGQINPGSLLNPLFEYVAGPYAVNGTTLYVNRGFGTVGPPARVGSPPEITRIVLVGT